MSLKDIDEAVQFIKEKSLIRPRVGIVLGSGWKGFVDQIQDKEVIPYAMIPHYPISTVAGHEGELILGYINHVPLVCLVGRPHFYEGYPLEKVIFPIRVMKVFGVETIILTNACGGIRNDLRPGDFMMINDHLNLVGINPLMGPNLDQLGPRFPNADDIYSSDLRQLAKTLVMDSSHHSYPFKEGVYAWWSGPSYETKAEIRMLSILGADAVGMSTVPEALAASQMKMKVFALALITNQATGLSDEVLTHEAVLRVGHESIQNIIPWMCRFIERC